MKTQSGSLRRLTRQLAITLLLAAPAALSALPILIHQYDFNSPAGQALDSVGTAHGTLMNGATITGGLLQLDGGNDYVQFGQYLVPTGNVPFSVQMRAQELAQLHPLVELISQGVSGLPAPNFFLGYDASHRFRISDNIVSTGVPFPGDAQFHTYTVTMDFSGPFAGTRLYVDGAIMGVWSPLFVAPAGDFTRIGTQFQAYPEYFRGNIDYLSVYMGALSPTEIQTLIKPPSTPPATYVPDATGTLGLLAAAMAFLGGSRHRLVSAASRSVAAASTPGRCR